MVNGRVSVGNGEGESSPEQSFCIFYQILDQSMIHFIGGDWMTAAVTDIVGDHLRRNKISHELFSKVAYRGPIELGNTQSDFDVIALRVGEHAAHGF